VIPQEKLESLIDRLAQLEAEMASESAADPEIYTRLSKEYAGLQPIARGAATFIDLKNEIEELESLSAEDAGDAEVAALAAEELEAARIRLPELEQELKLLLLPKDAADDKNAILEIRAGTGGDEAALFAGSLMRMYENYADLRGWRHEAMQLSETDLGGVKEAVLSISGTGVFARLKFESGVHRVQRVPETEASGRIHTSAATVAVLPEAEEVDVQLDDKDLRIDVFRASGPGGQSVNTTDSAVRITHLPTGIVVQQQDEKSQHKNKAKAMKVLRARIYEAERAERDAERAASRKGQVGSGDRSERIRTYNYPQGRVTDHRIGLTLYKLDKIVSGEALDEVIEPLIAEDQASRLAETGDDADTNE
jgi:peptide chain release factor 1